MPETMTLRVKNVSLLAMLERTNGSQKTWVQTLALDSYTNFGQVL